LMLGIAIVAILAAVVAWLRQRTYY
jgi:hypothetical protein